MEGLSTILAEEEPIRSIKLKLRTLEWEIEQYFSVLENTHAAENLSFAHSKIASNLERKDKIIKESAEYLI